MALQMLAPHRGYEGPVTIGDVTVTFSKGVADVTLLSPEIRDVLKAQGFQFLEGRVL